MISTVILLIFLGILIFYLTNPDYFKDSFDNTTGNTSDMNNNKGGSVGSGITESGNAGNAGNPDNAGNAGNPGNPGNTETTIPTQQIWTDPGRTHLNTIVDTNNHITNDNTLFSFTSNIDSSDITGADLNTAFEPPSGNHNTQDVIDFNKNNLEKYNVKDYLPKDVNKDWFNTDFSQAQHNIDDNNLINPDRFIIGINTVGQSLKSPSWDIRGSPPCPKYAISPWNNSTFEPDYNIKPLC